MTPLFSEPLKSLQIKEHPTGSHLSHSNVTTSPSPKPNGEMQLDLSDIFFHPKTSPQLVRVEPLIQSLMHKTVILEDFLGLDTILSETQ